MKRPSTILRQIEMLHRELNSYEDEEIAKAYKNLSKKGMTFGWVVDTIYDGLILEENDEEDYDSSGFNC